MPVNSASSADAAEAPTRLQAARPVARRVRRIALATAIAAGSVAGVVVAVMLVGGLLLQGIAVALTLVPRAIVWLALAAQDGADWWSIAGRAGGAVVATLASSQVMWWLVGLELVGVAALIGLQKMLRDEMRGGDSEEEKQ